MTPSYPDDCVQAVASPWWTETQDKVPRRGHLLWATVPHVTQIPVALEVVGRGEDPTDHSAAVYRLRAENIREATGTRTLPTAGAPEVPGQKRYVYNVKKRPVLVVCAGGHDVERGLTIGQARSQTAPTLLVAPYYGIDQSATRGGFNEGFVERIRRAAYPQFMWDSLPVGQRTPQSLLRLDHVQPIGRHHDAYEWTPFRLSDDALAVLKEWLDWLFLGRLPESGFLAEFRKEMLRT